MKSDIHLLLARADDGSATLERGLESSALGSFATAAPPSPTFLGDAGADPNDLSRQRWGVVAPRGPRGDRLLDLVAPLVRHRQAEQGAPVRTYRCPERLGAAEAWQWRRASFDTARESVLEVPEFVLVLGDLDEVPHAVQQVLATDRCVGRLAGADDDGIRAYVDKVIRQEGAADPRLPNLAIRTVDDGTQATHLGRSALAEPAAALITEHIARGTTRVANPDTICAVVSTETDLLGFDTGTTALLTISHGLGPPRGGWASEEERRLLQGAPSLGAGGAIGIDRVGTRPFLPGGVWFTQACFGGGTPEVSVYAPWLRRLAEHDAFRGPLGDVLEGLAADGPFVSRTALAALCNPEGPLAVIGHVDLAWSYAMAEIDVRHGRTRTTARAARYADLLEFVVRGDRVGLAFKLLYRFVGQISTDLAMSQSEAVRSGDSDWEHGLRAGHLHMLREDLSGFIVLGDPAVRLQVPTVPEPQASSVASLLGLPPSAEPASTERPTIDRIEEAIAELILGERGPRAIARDLGVERADLERWAAAYRRAGRGTL